MSAARDADRPLDETRVTADLPGLRIELLRRELPEAGAERITIDLLATASFAALKLPYGLAPMMAANPALLWMKMAEAAWRPWLDLMCLPGFGVREGRKTRPETIPEDPETQSR